MLRLTATVLVLALGVACTPYHRPHHHHHHPHHVDKPGDKPGDKDRPKRDRKPQREGLNALVPRRMVVPQPVKQ